MFIHAMKSHFEESESFGCIKNRLTDWRLSPPLFPPTWDKMVSQSLDGDCRHLGKKLSESVNSSLILSVGVIKLAMLEALHVPLYRPHSRPKQFYCSFIFISSMNSWDFLLCSYHKMHIWTVFLPLSVSFYSLVCPSPSSVKDFIVKRKNSQVQFFPSPMFLSIKNLRLGYDKTQ